MRTMRRQVLTHDVDRWAMAFLDALARPGIGGPALIATGDGVNPDPA